MMEIGKGTISSILGDKDIICDIIPVDFVVNTLILMAQKATLGRFVSWFHEVQLLNIYIYEPYIQQSLHCQRHFGCYESHYMGAPRLSDTKVVAYLSDQAYFNVSELQVPKKFYVTRNCRYFATLCTRFIDGSANIIAAETKICFADCKKI